MSDPLLAVTSESPHRTSLELLFSATSWQKRAVPLVASFTAVPVPVISGMLKNEMACCALTEMAHSNIAIKRRFMPAIVPLNLPDGCILTLMRCFLACLFASVLSAQYGPPGGPSTSAAVVALFTGCSGLQYLGADGACHAGQSLTLPVSGANGGTGVANTGFTITLGGNLVTSGANSLTFTTTGPTNVTLPTSGTLGTGTVTSASFTGGLVSIANPTTTPALTVAGTSGGIPYFSAASTWASSAALAAGAVVLGGGAGVTPQTAGNLIVSNIGTGTELWTLYNPTASTGATEFRIRAGAGDASGAKLLHGYLNDGTTEEWYISRNGVLGVNGGVNFQPTIGSNSFTLSGVATAVQANMNALGCFGFTQDGANITHGPDTNLCRDSAGTIDFGTGAQGSTAGSAKLASVITAGTKFTTTGCSVSATTGGATAGTFTSGTTGTCTVVITMNGATGLTAPNGWACQANDRTTFASFANDFQQTASSTATATVSATTVSGDVVSFYCMGY